MIWLLLILSTLHVLNQIYKAGNPSSHYDLCGGKSNRPSELMHQENVFQEELKLHFYDNRNMNSNSTILIKNGEFTEQSAFSTILRETSKSFASEATCPVNRRLYIRQKLNMYEHRIVTGYGALSSDDKVKITDGPPFFSIPPSQNPYTGLKGDSGGNMRILEDWSVGTNRTRCVWPAFWTVVCPWYGIRHCHGN